MKHNRSFHVSVIGLLSALTVALSVLEGWLPAIPVAGARLGLANVTVMYALVHLSFPSAAAVTAVKCLFALFRGITAFLMSATGSVLALLMMWGMRKLCKERLGAVGLGIVGAVAHNIGQWCVAYAMLGTAMRYYAPILLLLALPAGVITGLVLHVTTPYFKRIAGEGQSPRRP